MDGILKQLLLSESSGEAACQALHDELLASLVLCSDQSSYKQVCHLKAPKFIVAVPSGTHGVQAAP
jgi:hypothetical protein